MLRTAKALVILPLFVVVASCMLMPGPDLRGLKLVSVSKILPDSSVNTAQNGTNPWPNRGVLVVNFTADRDLAEYAKQYEYNIGNDTSFCHETSIDTARPLQSHPYIFDAVGKVDAYRRYEVGETNLAMRQSIYHIYIAIRSMPLAGQSVFDYDLHNPDDICIQLRGGNMLGDSFVSNTIVVPKAAITDALAHD